jgi:EAL domain-containing protein (putative c-di-GMP-specific phosphodiesterase class I)
VKVDRTFTAGLPGDAANDAIVRSTVELAHTLGATVVAEGVEAPAQWEHLAGIGCDIAQGYLVGVPMAGDAIVPAGGASTPLRVVA